MRKKVMRIAVGATLVALSVVGIALLQTHKQKEEAFKQLELLKQQEEAKAKQAEENRKGEEAKRLTEIAVQRKFEEERRKIEEERKRLEEQRRFAKEEAQRKEQLAEAEARRREEEARFKEEQRRREQAEIERKRAEAEKEARRLEKEREAKKIEAAKEARREAEELERQAKKRTLIVRLKMDSARAQEIPVARVHAGDSVKVQIHRSQGVHAKLYVGLAEPHDSSGMRVIKMTGGILNVPISDNDTFRIKDLLSKRAANETQEGIILYVGTGFVPTQALRGNIWLEMEIYANNRWNIMARRER